MISSIKEFLEQRGEIVPVLDASIPFTKYCPLNLSSENEDLQAFDITCPDECQRYIDAILTKHRASVAYGGYLEKRNLYAKTQSFSNAKTNRNIHLGIDFWAKAGTKVLAPLAGSIHSFQNNAAKGDYGPTLILQHEVNGFKFHTLYGHLSLESLQGVQVGQIFQQGDVLAELGTTVINVNYAPHLHFQVIINMQGMQGDYPGVCSEDELNFYAENCPNPNILLNF